jgi:chorismate mutase
VTTDPSTRLAEIRAEIDRIDREILGLLEERTNFALEAGAAKAALGRPVHDPEREAQLLARIGAQGAGALSPADLRALWELLIEATRRAESRR